ncbi:cytoplasmic iron level regulating protein YaaA (DUF328/UPF0246 family) [Arcanobacterium wilhelmae]|uniref:Cytoplasmic iron level regulating protein YaaA (DUF328/UPF0246 family) n=1 Tax=Arcanobacterium wilhelmae TaxID=1803177 RepID=A0ABT9N911_9ACTO|nr:peroxide stress protein YaaA [Arcanobacterium wilhelmae]MDP9800199.1 cytoplasmic iron level regulating protein YaaA (DUF328/UPF0246 family) [Arcanobacterium wilhelmae]WFN89640.1 peroxide stress protein YaaA [Arcanobacterium wilhelmae]
MQIFLPPSEGKTAPASGAPLDFDSLAFPELTPLRRELTAELVEVSARDDALSVLKVGTSVAPEVRRQRDLLSLPTSHSLEVYSGVLFSALDVANFTDADWARANERIVTFSGLFGMLRPSDRIPAYRLKMGVKLPGGNNTTRWRNTLRDVGSFDGELIVDARSGGYQVFSPARATMVEVRAERVKGGKRAVISHDAKRYRGVLAAALVREPNAPTSAAELAEFARVLVDAGHVTSVELHEGKTAQLTLVDEA